MARVAFIYNAFQGTQRQRPIVAALVAFEAAAWPVTQVANDCPKNKALVFIISIDCHDNDHITIAPPTKRDDLGQSAVL